MARKKQETLVLFPDVAEITVDFSNEMFGELMRAAFAYRFSGEEYSGDDTSVKLAFRMLRGQIDRYERVRRINSKNAKGESAAEDESEMQRNAAECGEIQGNPPHTRSPVPSPCPTHSPERELGDAAAPPTPAKSKEKKFIPPTVEQVEAFCTNKGLNIDAARFVDYYTSIGWRVGKNPMRNWQATVRNWDRGTGNGSGCSTQPTKPRPAASTEDEYEVGFANGNVKF